MPLPSTTDTSRTVVESPRETSSGTEQATRRALLLIVERDPHVRHLEEFFLSEAGFEVQFVDNGLDALESARSLRPSIIVTEVIVPKLDGLSLCRTIKSTDGLRDTIVVVFSLLAVSQRAREAGADAFLLKPLGADRLVATVRDLLSRNPASFPTEMQT